MNDNDKIKHSRDSIFGIIHLRNIKHYKMNLVYKHEVKGKEYESNLIGYGFPMNMSVLYVDKTLNNIFETAPNLKVYYNPKKT